ncbi:TPA: ASCH domain-containing protein [Providencia rettgeri]
MKDRIKFNDAMLAAVMNGRKTQTRRPVDKETLRLFDIASEAGECFPLGYNADEPFEKYHLEFFPYGQVGGIINLADKDGNIKGKIEITDVWLQQVQEISQQDARSEGFEFTGWRPTYSDPDSGGETFTPYDNFAEAWIDIYGEDGWNNNPWVWVIEFKKVE